MRAFPARQPEHSACLMTKLLGIDRVVLSGERSDAFQWPLDAIGGPQGDDSPVGRCLGTEGVNIVLTRVQQAVIERGFVTTLACWLAW